MSEGGNKRLPVEPRAKLPIDFGDRTVCFRVAFGILTQDLLKTPLASLIQPGGAGMLSRALAHPFQVPCRSGTILKLYNSSVFTGIVVDRIEITDQLLKRDALPLRPHFGPRFGAGGDTNLPFRSKQCLYFFKVARSEEHTSELQSQSNLVC